MTSFGILPTHEKHVLHTVDQITGTNADTIRVEAAFGSMLKERLVVFADNFTSDNININSTDRGSVICVPTAEEDPINISLKLHRQWVGSVG